MTIEDQQTTTFLTGTEGTKNTDVDNSCKENEKGGPTPMSCASNPALAGAGARLGLLDDRDRAQTNLTPSGVRRSFPLVTFRYGDIKGALYRSIFPAGILMSVRVE